MNKLIRKAYDTTSVGDLYKALEHKITNLKCHHYDFDIIMQCTENILAHVFKKALPDLNNIAPIIDILKIKIMEQVKPAANKSDYYL